VAGGIVMADGKLTWLTTKQDGSPTDYAIEKLEAAGIGGGGTGAVDSVNGQTGVVVLDAADVGARPAGSFAERVPTGRILDVDNLTLVGGSAALTPTTWDTYDGNDVIVHPSVLFFPDGFGGYQWWAAATPYYNTDVALENPSIFVSTNGSDWVPPPGVTNPVVPEPTGGNFNSDPYLTTGPDGMLWLVYREALTGSNEELFVRASDDGVTWSAPTSLMTNTGESRVMLAPSMWWDAIASEWVLLVSRFGTGADKYLRRFTAPAPTGPWVEGANPTVSAAWDTNFGIWHMSARPVGAQVVALANVDDVGHDGGRVYLMTSNDAGRTWTRATTYLDIGTTLGYQSCFVPILTEFGLALDTWIGFAEYHGWGAKRGIAARTGGV
jgi:hypothetical protein